jgi:protein TonB
MKRTLLLTSLFYFSLLSASSQTVDTISKESTMPPPPPENAIAEKDDDGDIRIFTKVEQEAEFPGGNKAWIEFLTSKLGSFDASKNGAPKGIYKVVARFIVSKTGKISAAETETNHGYGMEKEVIRMIKQSPDWLPAMQNGRAVNAYRRQPVTFVVE